MQFYKKGSEDVLNALGIETPETLQEIERHIPQPIKDIRETFSPSFRGTPYSAIFGRYKGTTANILKKLKQKFEDITP